MHVNCGCNGENCKINIARVIFGLRLKSALLLIGWAVGSFALQLRNIIVGWGGQKVFCPQLMLCIVTLLRNLAIL